ncbi:uncharacterized protein LOC119651784 [Hermetia illucens]|nr:uncharacterized protein LOC119651784 [Hermetia illucens]
MNKTNGFREKAGASTSLYNKEHIKSNQRGSTSGLSFLKWFKKTEKSSVDSRCSTKSIDRNFHRPKHHRNNSHDTLSPSSSPNLEYLSPSSSCDSIDSTSTTGFAFIKPNNYRPPNDIARRTFFTQEFDETISCRTANTAQPELTLRRKYCLYDADTLTSTEGDYDNIRFGDRSLPHLRNKSKGDQRTLRQRRRTRRTVSDSSKDKRSGAYVHVKGKRKAPPPPSHLTNGTTSKESPSKSLNTLGRKKRKAPPPPNSPATPLSTNSPNQSFQLGDSVNDMDLKALIRNSTPNPRVTESSDVVIMRHSTPLPSREKEDLSAAQKLTEQQKQIVLDNIVKVTQSASSSEVEINAAPPQSPISPRPWYKRPISSHRDSSVPFKREIVLKTMEKRKSKQKEKTPKPEKSSEVNHSRSSLFEASSKLSLFLRGKDHTEKDKEKRRSGIGIPNISELDREAAEIVNREYACAQAAEKSETEKFFSKSDHITLQQEMFGSKSNINSSKEEAKEEEQEEVIQSTKDLISKFEASANGPRITLNTSFIGRKDNFIKQSSKDGATETKLETSQNDIETEKTEVSSSQQKDNIENAVSEKGEAVLRPKLSSDINPIRMSWTCGFCTLENPGWRIICEVCEHIKPYEKRTSIEEVNQNIKAAVAIPTKEENLNNNLNSQVNKTEQTTNWDKKTEKVLKYFMPKAGNNPLAKSSSESSVGKHQLFRKSPSPNKPPTGSPQLGVRSKLARVNQTDNMKPIGFTSGFKSTGTIPEEKEGMTPSDEKKKPLLDSSVVVTTVTPVFYARTTLVKNPQVATLSETEKLPAKGETSIEEKAIPESNGKTETRQATQIDLNAEAIALSKEESTVETTTSIIEPKIDVKEVRKARLAKFSVSQEPAVSTQPIPIYDHNSLEREKKRLRDMIQAMNAKALAEKYPASTNKKPPTIEEDQSQTTTTASTTNNTSTEATNSPNTEMKPTPPNDQAKLGAIKKVFAKNRNSDAPKKLSDVDLAKPKKVSTSAQTTGVVKKSLTPEDTDKQGLNIYANIPIYENSPLEKFDKNIRLTENDRAKMQEISQQLTSEQGINDFKASLRNPPKGISATDTIALSKIMRNLETAIAEGQHELAAQIAIDLARMKVSLHVTKQKDRPVSRTDADFEKSIIVDMFVEDKYSQKGPIQIAITPLLTILQLKQKIATDFDIPVGVQRWSINDDLAMDDEKTLLEFGVKDHTPTFYLYIVAPDVHFYEVKKSNVDSKPLLPKVNQQKVETPPKIESPSKVANVRKTNSPTKNEVQETTELGATALPEAVVEKQAPPTTWQCNLCTLINPIEHTACLACTKPRPKDQQQPEQPIKKPVVQLRPAEKKNDLNKTSPNRKSTDVFNIVDIKIDIKKTVTDQIKPIPNADSPNISKTKYRGVDNFNPNRKKGEAPKPGALNKTGRKSTVAPSPPKKAEQNKNHYLELLSLDNADVVPNIEAFECPICFMNFETGQGVILRDCLHTFCKECLAHTVQYSEDAEIKCPYMDTEYSCDSVLQEREVRALVSKEIYELHLVKSMRMAEHQIDNAFHCKTPNCRGWCIYEDNVNQFKCPVCTITNCLTCRVIHDGLTCKQYQDRLNSDCDSNADAKQTKEMLEQMLKNGEAMNCPTCQVVMMKKWGCDWLKCSMCKTEICWVTRGPRWGPGGKGDTSAGCRCGVDNVKCHPKCNYCH